MLAIIYIAPMVMLLMTSVKTLPEFNKSPVALPTTLALENYVEAWNKANFPRYLLNTILYTVVSATIFVITGTFLSVAMMLRHGLEDGAGADRIDAAVERALVEGLRTADLFTGADGERLVGTAEMTEAVIAAL